MKSEVTVVIPYFNESKTIAKTLELIGKQSIPPKEAIIVNSSSTDDSFLVVDAWINQNQEKFVTRFRNIDKSTKNPGSSKNIGIKISKTNWIAFMDCGQKFPTDWIECQINYINSKKLDVSFGVVYLNGVNWVDRCAIAQTYGYKQLRSCVPGTLLKRNVFDATSLFLEGRRSGYDMIWQSKVKKIIEKYDVNSGSRIEYEGVNFSNTLLGLYKKSILYSRTALGLEGYYTPYFYIFFLMFLIWIFFSMSELLIPIVASYIVFRIFLLPIYKSKAVSIYKEHPLESIFGFPITSVIIDLGKLTGYFFGIYDYLAKKIFR
jgi:glycosyltransferase involved in cell wall biosynthesis